jgi:hypothetical protein
MATFHRKGGNFGPEWVATFKRNAGNFAPDYARAFVNAPMLILENGKVRKRSSFESFPISKDITKCPGFFHDQINKVNMQIVIDKDFLRGSGRSIPQAVAYILGVIPGVTKKFTNPKSNVTVGWSEKSTTGPFIGSIRNIITDLNIRINDRIRLEFNIELRTIAAYIINISDDLTPEEQLLELTGLTMEGDITSTLSKSLNVEKKNLYKILSLRKDNELLSLIEGNNKDSSLDKALESFAEILDT